MCNNKYCKYYKNNICHCNVQKISKLNIIKDSIFLMMFNNIGKDDIKHIYNS